jgi:hypothetical protein
MTLSPEYIDGQESDRKSVEVDLASWAITIAVLQDIYEALKEDRLTVNPLAGDNNIIKQYMALLYEHKFEEARNVVISICNVANQSNERSSFNAHERMTTINIIQNDGKRTPAPNRAFLLATGYLHETPEMPEKVKTAYPYAHDLVSLNQDAFRLHYLDRASYEVNATGVSANLALIIAKMRHDMSFWLDHEL